MLLVATPALLDPNFADTVVLLLDVVEHEEQPDGDLFAFIERTVAVQARAALRKVARHRREHRSRCPNLGGHA